MKTRRNKIAFALYAILCIIMAAATFVEDRCGTDFAHRYIYDAWWFIGLWIAAVALSLPCIPTHIRALARWMRGKRREAGVILLLMMTCAVSKANAAEVRVVERVQADSMKRVQVAYNRRICPLNTVAREFTLKLTGSTTFEGLTPEQVLLSWAEYPEEWKDVAMIKVKKSEVRQRLGIKGKYARFSDFFDSNGNPRIDIERYPDIEDRLTLIAMLTRGMLFEPIPQGREAVAQEKIEAEIVYNAVPWDTILFISCFTLALFLFVAEWKKFSAMQCRCAAIAFSVAKCVLAAFLLTALVLRWYISEHLPLSNTYETLLVTALVALLCACFSRKASPALIVAASCLLVAHLGSLDPQVTPLMPVLQSAWLSWHVASIMISYCLFALLMFRPNRLMLVWAEVLLGTGILLGAVWAKTAWGA